MERTSRLVPRGEEVGDVRHRLPGKAEQILRFAGEAVVGLHRGSGRVVDGFDQGVEAVFEVQPEEVHPHAAEQIDFRGGGASASAEASPDLGEQRLGALPGIGVCRTGCVV